MTCCTKFNLMNILEPCLKFESTIQITILHHFHMMSQPLFHTEKREKSLLFAFEIESNKMILCSPKHLSARQFVRNFHLDVVPASVSRSNVRRVYNEHSIPKIDHAICTTQNRSRTSSAQVQ